MRVPLMAVLGLAASIAGTVLPAQIDWIRLQPSAAPGARSKARMEHDPRTGRTLLFGGVDGLGNTLDETWEWNGTTWTQLSPTIRPPGRWQHATAFDPVRGALVLFSGWDGGAYPHDTWEWNGAAWINVTPALQPTERDHHAMTFDGKSGKTILFGGWNYFLAQMLFDDTWEWNGATWTQVTTTGTPPARDGHAMCYDPVRGNIVLYGGGREPQGQPPRGDTWLYDSATSTWTQASPATNPGARFNHRMVWDPERRRVVLFGGFAATPLNDTWEWDGVDWRKRFPSPAPSKRQYADMAFDTTRHSVLLFGGDDGSAGGGIPNGETWEYKPRFRADVRSYGQGCAGSAGTPMLASAGESAWLGVTMRIAVRNLPASSNGAMMFGISDQRFGGIALPIDLTLIGMNGCRLYQDLLFSFPFTGTGGAATWNLPVPKDASLPGFVFYLQAFVPDPGVNAFGATTSDALAVTIGAR